MSYKKQYTHYSIGFMFPLLGHSKKLFIDIDIS